MTPGISGRDGLWASRQGLGNPPPAKAALPAVVYISGMSDTFDMHEYELSTGLVELSRYCRTGRIVIVFKVSSGTFEG